MPAVGVLRYALRATRFIFVLYIWKGVYCWFYQLINYNNTTFYRFQQGFRGGFWGEFL